METEEREDALEKQAAEVKAEPEEEEDDGASGHTCGVCGRNFPLLSSLSQHMRRHTQEKPYKCPYCEHRTAQKGSLKAHVRSHKLGLLGRGLSDGDRGPKDEAESPEPPEGLGKSDKAPHVNGKVRKKGARKKVKRKGGGGGGEEGDGADGAGPFSCVICGQVFPQVLLLKTHMKRHRGSQDHGCRICGRRFRQAWFLQSHMRIHRVKGQLGGGGGGGRSNDPPATINGVPQDPASLINEECLYELCAGCGNFFVDHKTLRTHEKLHKPNHSCRPEGLDSREDPEASEPHVVKRRFFESLNLTCAGRKDTTEDKNPGGRIQELDPICSYQAWQLATRGRLVEASEKCLGWEERLADAEVAYDTEKGEYVPLKQEKKRKQGDAAAAAGVKKKKGEAGSEQTAPARGGDKKVSQKDRILLNGLGHAFYEAMHAKKAKDVHFPSKQSRNIRSQEQGDKSYVCDHCDFHTGDASHLRSHLLRQHQDFLGPFSKASAAPAGVGKPAAKASRYMDYLRSRSVLLSQPFWNPYTCPPSQLAEPSVKAERSKGEEVGGRGQGQVAGEAGGGLLNLSSDGDGRASRPVKAEGLARHQCPYCSHTTSYPEVLWIHQRVAHRVDSGSSAAPKWAPSFHSCKSLKAGVSQWRRTGPPPFLEGKDCPALLAPRAHRTQPPGAAAPSSSSSSKHPTPKTQSGNPKSKHHAKDSRTQPSAKAGLPPQKKPADPNRAAAEGGSKGPGAPTSSNSVAPGKNPPGLPPTVGPKAKGGSRAAVEGNFPQEGLGFMLSRNHGGGTSSNAAGDRLHARRPSSDFSSGPKGPDLWAAMNMWGLHGSKAYLDPLLFAQGKSGSAGDVPMDIDILGLLKNYSPHELAALYQHWGFVDPRLNPQDEQKLHIILRVPP